MKRSIEQIMDLFFQELFWGLEKQKKPNETELSQFQKDYSLPHDYVEMLSRTDGFVLFQAGDFQIYNISFVIESNTKPEYDMGLVESVLWNVGYFMGQSLLINLRESHTLSYLYVGEAGSVTDYIRIGTITDFFNGLIQSNGEVPFWKTKGQELFDFTIENLEKSPGILEVPAQGRTIVSTRPYYPSAEEVRVSGLSNAVILEYSNGMEERLFLHENEIGLYDLLC